jgi:predicted DNA-binding protein
MRSRGRPKTGVARERIYHIRMSDNELEMFNYVAENLGMTKSDLLRSLVESKYRMLKWYEK